MRQFIACKFNPWDRKTYTYHNDGDPVAVGDRVRVETNKGTVAVSVESLCDPPSYATKPILGRVEEAPPAPQGSLL